mmetsp:Transcript_25188/g.18972  ORF Transcript_25188/g.18972 Transcript_25188/m.18972 type:complete len:93 (-) Transcript_25188:31-309(-)
MNHKDLLHTIQIRQKPKATVEKVIQRLTMPMKLKQKYEDHIVALEKKEREMKVEVEQLKGQVEMMEKKCKEIVEVLERDLSAKLKANVKVSM